MAAASRDFDDGGTTKTDPQFGARIGRPRTFQSGKCICALRAVSPGMSRLRRSGNPNGTGTDQRGRPIWQGSIRAEAATTARGCLGGALGSALLLLV